MASAIGMAERPDVIPSLGQGALIRADPAVNARPPAQPRNGLNCRNGVRNPMTLTTGVEVSASARPSVWLICPGRPSVSTQISSVTSETRLIKSLAPALGEGKVG